jgi:phosphatidylinositol alpha 1,6-mannosyltransferase
MRIAYTAGKMVEEYDGVTRVLFKWSEHLQKKNIPHIFISGEVPPKEKQNVPMFRVPSIPFPLYKEYPFSLPSPKTFDAVLNEFKPDIIHFNSPCPLAFASLKYGRKHDVPVVSTYHTHFLSYAQYYKLKPFVEAGWMLYHHVYNQCAQVYVPSTPILDELEAGGLRTLQFLPHGVDVNAFNPTFFSENWKKEIGAEDKFVVLYAGRLVWEKDLRVLADVYKSLTQNRKDVVFVLAGDGPIQNELEQMMPDAIFLGHLNTKQVATAFASSDAFIFPSKTETFGNVTLEAMACGNVPLCAAAGGALDLIRNEENGFLIEPDDVNGFVKAITALADNPSLRNAMVERALAFAQQQSWDTIVEKMLALYSTAINSFSAAHAA